MRGLLLLSLLSALFLAVSGQSYSNQIQLLAAPTTIPASGTWSAVLEWESNVADTLNLHIDLSDVTKNYAYDGGAFAQVKGPGAGFVSMILPINQVLNPGDSYLLHFYITSLSNSTLYGAANDWQHVTVEGYQGVTVSTAALPNSMTLLSVPSTIPNSGYFVGDVYWSSNLPGWTMLHFDLGDVTQNYAYNGGAAVNVTSPGSGVVKMNMSIINPQQPGQPLSVGDTYDIHLYMASAYNNTMFASDWNHNSFEAYYSATVAAASSFANSITLVNPPQYIPVSGNFTVNCAWSTNITGVVNLHVDISDITQSYAYDGGALVQVVGPGAGVTPITVTITTSAAAIDKMQLHTYMLDEVSSQSYATPTSNNDYLHSLYDAYYPVAQGVNPTFPNYVTIYRAPTTIPRQGQINVVLEWSSNLATSTTIHLDLSDITQSYAYDGGVSVVVPSPGSGFVTLQLPITTTLNPGDAYQLHAYLASYANTTLYGSGNDWQHSSYDLYQTVTVGFQSLTNSLQILNVPTTIPTTGSIQLEVYYTSNIANGTIVHVDLSDVTKSWQYETGAQVTVASPSVGTVTLTIQLPASLGLTVGDSFNLHGYLTSVANSTLYGATNDWAHTAVDSYNTVSVATQASFPLSLVPINPPTVVPRTGNFTLSYSWSSNYTGEINLHVDLSDVSQAYAYDGGDMVTVTSPGAGIVSFTINLGAASLSTGDSFQLHGYITPVTTSLQYGVGNDWQHTIYDGYTPVTAGQVQPPRPYPYSVAFFQPPSTIPNSGTISVVVEYSSNAPTSTTVHVDLSDITQSYAYDGGVSVVVPSPGTGTVTLLLPISGSLNTGDLYQLHAYLTGYANTSLYGATNDWQNAAIDLYQPVVVSSTPLGNFMQILNVPSVVPSVGSIQLEVFYTSNLANATTLHVDFSDVTQSWLYETGTSVQVPSPGSGTVVMTLSLTSALALKFGDSFNLHGYMTSLANTTQYGSSNDWAHSSYDSYNTVTIGTAAQFPISLTPVNPPSQVPNTGNFSVQYAWSCNYTGMINLHVDMSDVTQSYAYDAGYMVQVSSPGSGIATFILNLGSSKLATADSYTLHAYITPTSVGLQNGTSNDWQNAIYNGYTTVTSGALTNSISFINPPTVIPSSGYFIFQIAYTSNVTTGLNIHVDLNDFTQNWAFDTGVFYQVTQQTGTLTVNFTIPSTLVLPAGDSYRLHAYMSSTVAANAGGPNWQDYLNSLFDAFATVTIASGGSLSSSLSLATTPSTIPTSGTESFLMLWSSPYVGLINLHLDISDVTQNYLYEAGAYAQVTGPGSGSVVMTLQLGSVAVKAGDNYTLHLYMTSLANSTANGGSGNDWQVASVNTFYPVTAGGATFTNSLTITPAPTTIPTSGSVTYQCAWSSSITGNINLHLDLSDVTTNYGYDGGATVAVAGPGSGVVSMTIAITASMPVSDSYIIHAYLTGAANTTLYGSSNDWQHTAYDGYYTVTPQGGSSSNGGSGSSSSSSSSSKLSGGAIAGIVIGVVVGVAILAAFIFFFACSGRRFSKGSKMDDGTDRATGAHSRYEDEQSQVGESQAGNIEMGETHANEEA